MATFFATKGKFLRIGSIKFSNHLFTTSREDDMNKIRNSQGFGISIFELPDGVNAADLIKDTMPTLGPLTTTNIKAQPHKSLQHFFQSKQAEILDTESRMQASRSSPLLAPSSLHSYNKQTLQKLCDDFFVEYHVDDTRKALIQRLKTFSGQPEE